VVKEHGAKKAHGESLETKQKVGNVEPLKSKAEGSEIKHAWYWPRMGEWFQDKGWRTEALTGGLADDI
jgi:pyruvate decarboxylase